jgi:hypothetical protein
MAIVAATVVAASIAPAIGTGTARYIAAADCSPYIGIRRAGGEYEQRENAKSAFHVSLLGLEVPEWLTTRSK